MAIFGARCRRRALRSRIRSAALTALRTAILGCARCLAAGVATPLPPRRLWFQLMIAMLCVSILFRADGARGADGRCLAWRCVMGFFPSPPRWLPSPLTTSGRTRVLIASCSRASAGDRVRLGQGGGTLFGRRLRVRRSRRLGDRYAFSGRLTAGMPGWEVISWVLVLAFPISLPAAAPTCPDLTQIGLEAVLALLYVAVFSQ